MAQTFRGRQVWVCETPQLNDLTSDEFEALTWIRILGAGSVGQTGTSDTNSSYDELDADVVDKAKGQRNAGDPVIEVSWRAGDAGQLITRAAALTETPHAFKIVDFEQDLGYTPTIYYYRALVSGPTKPNGRQDSFRVDQFNLACVQPEIEYPAALYPDWVPTETINGLFSYARAHYDFAAAGEGQYWERFKERDFDEVIRYSCASRSPMYQKADGTWGDVDVDVPAREVGFGIFNWKSSQVNLKYNRDLRISYRCSVSGIGAGESLVDGQSVTTVEGGSGIYVATGEGVGIAALANWTGTAPATGHTLNITGGSCTIGSSVTQIWQRSNATITYDATGGIDGGGCSVVEATGANAKVYQTVTISAAVRSSTAWLKRVTGSGDIGLGILNGGTSFDTVKVIDSALFTRCASALSTSAANPSVGIQIATSGDKVKVDYFNMGTSAPVDTECVATDQIGKGLACTPTFGGSKGSTIIISPMQMDCFSELQNIISDITRFTVICEYMNTSDITGGNVVQIDADGTMTNSAIQNFSATGTASNNNFGVTYNPGAFGNDPQGPKSIANKKHRVAWTANLNHLTEYSGNGWVSIAADSSTANENHGHSITDDLPVGLKFIRFMQWRLDALLGGAPGQGQMPGGWTGRFTIFDGVATNEDLERMVEGF